MSVFKAKTIPQAWSQDLDQRTWLSVNLQTADEGFYYNPNHVVVPAPTSSALVRAFPTALQNTFKSTAVNYPPAFYKGLHYTINEAVYDGRNYNVGVVTSTVQLLVYVQSMSEAKRTVSSISVTADQGISLSGINVGTVFNPYEEKTLSVVLEQVGVASFNAEISIQFVGDANTYSMRLVGFRFYLPFMLASNWASSISVSRK